MTKPTIGTGSKIFALIRNLDRAEELLAGAVHLAY
jgi:hypothetical protein